MKALRLPRAVDGLRFSPAPVGVRPLHSRIGPPVINAG